MVARDFFLHTLVYESNAPQSPQIFLCFELHFLFEQELADPVFLGLGQWDSKSLT